MQTHENYLKSSVLDCSLFEDQSQWWKSNYFKSSVLELGEVAPSLPWTGSCKGSANTMSSTSLGSSTRCGRSASGWSRLNSNTFAFTRFCIRFDQIFILATKLFKIIISLILSDLTRFAFMLQNYSNWTFQCLLTVLEGKEHDERHERQLHDNEAFEDDEGIAESGMWTIVNNVNNWIETEEIQSWAKDNRPTRIEEWKSCPQDVGTWNPWKQMRILYMVRS